MTCVIDLQTHLNRAHNLYFPDPQFIEAVNDPPIVERQVYFKAESHQRYAVMDLDFPQIAVNNNQVENECNFHSFSEKEHSKASIFDFPSKDSDDTMESSQAAVIPDHRVKPKILQSILSFGNFLLTVSGGLRSQTFINMDQSNLKKLISTLGNQNLFCPEKLNEYVTHEMKFGKSPSTLLSRLLSLARYINYLKVYEDSILPYSKRMNALFAMMHGLETSLSKQKQRRQRDVMSKSRRCYPHTVEVLKGWRSARSSDNSISLFRTYIEHLDIEINSEEYTRMRDFLITELLIANAQRPGVITGLLRYEVDDAKTNITSEGYHKLAIDNHKTGNVQTATLFVYPEIFLALETFSNIILPRLPIYLRSSAELSMNSHVFQTLNGEILLSPRVTPILRHYLSQLGIWFRGTITDLRKAAATLTGKLAPDLHELMALYLCHSRKTHDRYYRIHLGHDGLSKAFEKLESFQTYPDAEIESPTMRSTDLDGSASIVDLQPSIHQSTPEFQGGTNPFWKTSEFELNLSTNALSEIELDLETLDSAENQPFPEDIQVLSKVNDISECNVEIDDIVPKQLNISENERCRGYKLKSFDINIRKLSCASLLKGTNDDLVTKFSVGAISPKFSTSNHRFSQNDAEIFDSVFSHLILMVAKKYPVSRKDVLTKMVDSTEFYPILEKLRRQFSNETLEKTVVYRVRTKGNFLRLHNKSNDNLVNTDLDISKDSQIHLLTTVKRNRSIFLLQKDEKIFLKLFSDLIQRVANRQTLNRCDVIDRMNHKEFSAVMIRLKSLYSDDICVKILSKVRTVGLTMRQKPHT